MKNGQANPADCLLSVAPMVGCTDQYFRRLLREITTETTLYTEMTVAAGVLHNPALLEFSEREHPIVLQLAGDDEKTLQQAGKLAFARGFDGLNLNFGCPSKAALAGGFGACMMQKPESAVRAFVALQEASPVPVSVKCRLGVKDHGKDANQEKDEFFSFIAGLERAGCRSLIVHARQAWLKGLNPRANRTRPPLNYGLVGEAAQTFPSVAITLNGGLCTPTHGLEVAGTNFAGVMLGRAVWNDPWCLSSADALIAGGQKVATTPASREEVLLDMIALSETALSNGGRAPSVLRGLARMWRGHNGASQWRALLAQVAANRETSLQSLRRFLQTRPLKTREQLALQAE